MSDPDASCMKLRRMMLNDGGTFTSSMSLWKKSFNHTSEANPTRFVDDVDDDADENDDADSDERFDKTIVGFKFFVLTFFRWNGNILLNVDDDHAVIDSTAYDMSNSNSSSVAIGLVVTTVLTFIL